MKNIQKSILVCALGALLTLPAMAISPILPRVNPPRTTWSFSTTRLEGIKIKTSGKITFSDDYKDVKAISPDGYLKISMVNFGMRRSLIIQNEDGKLVRIYSEGRHKVPFEPKGRKWMEEILPTVVRSTGIDAEARIKRIYQKQGIEGVIKELRVTENDYNQAKLVRYLLSDQDLSNDELLQLIRIFPYNIDSDYELSQLMKRYNTLFLRTPELSQEFFQGIKNIHSDYDASQVLKEVFRDNELNPENLEMLLKSMEDISSDYEKTNILKMALKKRNISSEITKKVMEATKNIHSDYEKTQLLNTLIKNQLIDPSNLDEFIELHSKISSDYSYTNILKDMVKYEKLGKKRFDYLLDASRNISSSYETGRYYEILLKTRQLNKEQQKKLLQLSSNISSSYELAQFLTEAAKSMDLRDQEILDALKKAARRINSNYDYGRVMKAIDAQTIDQ